MDCSEGDSHFSNQFQERPNRMFAQLPLEEVLLSHRYIPFIWVIVIGNKMDFAWLNRELKGFVCDLLKLANFLLYVVRTNMPSQDISTLGPPPGS
jgi:hypothetical protein